VRIAIVNDCPVAMEGLVRTIKESAEHEVAWTAANGQQAIENSALDLPDLILMDVMMPEIGGVEATRHIMRNTPCPILIVTASIRQHSDLVFDAMCAGAMDAVVTPRLYPAEGENDAGALLQKVHMIDVLTRDTRHTNQSQKVLQRDNDKLHYQNHLVVIGSSSGGPDALARIFSRVSVNNRASYVVIQHVDQQFAPAFARWLNDRTALSVELAVSGDSPAKNKVYIANGNNHLIIDEKGRFAYINEPWETFYRPSVDVFFNSVAQNWRSAAVTAILLTGMGKDGAQGLLELRNSGARTIAQDRFSSAVYGMPKAASDISAAQEIKSIVEIADLLENGFSTFC
jgi:two-component system response regulator WspF